MGMLHLLEDNNLVSMQLRLIEGKKILGNETWCILSVTSGENIIVLFQSHYFSDTGHLS